jgi:predicted Zn-dependent protease
MNRIFSILLPAIFSFMVLFVSCSKDNGGINIFTVEDDKQLGLQIEQEIAGNPAEYPLLNSNQYPEAYQHVERVRDAILATGLVDYDTEFAWKVYIVRNDTVLNAFCTPGGYIYFYTGIAILAFSREDEYESDEYSVQYLYETTCDARGVAGFFEKMAGSQQPPEFLSTHPNPENRIEKINEVWLGLGGKEGEKYPERYQEFKASLP